MSADLLDDHRVVLAPARPGSEEVLFETRRTAQGYICGLVFTSAERLVSCLGPEQPWVALSVGALRVLLGEAGISVIAVDPGTVETAA
ncbi:SAV_915 family protein [Streptomyces sp. NPDC002536]